MKILETIKANKGTIIKVGVGVIGTLVLVGALARKYMTDTDENDFEFEERFQSEVENQ